MQSVTKVKPIMMSLDISTTVEPSQFRHGEGCQDWTRANPVKNGRGSNDDWSDQHHGGVGGHGMQVQVGGVRNEISPGGRQRPAAGSSGQTTRLVWSAEKSERSIVAVKAVTTPERRGRTRLRRTAKRRT